MTNLGLSHYNQKLAQTTARSSFQSLRELYGLADKAMKALAKDVDGSDKTVELEGKFLKDKQFLIQMATEIRCEDHQEIFEKIHFLNFVYLDEKRNEDFTPEDNLLKSIHSDCQGFL